MLLGIRWPNCRGQLKTSSIRRQRQTFSLAPKCSSIGSKRPLGLAQMPSRTRTQTRTDRDLLRIATFILFDAAVYHEGLSGTGAIAGVISLRQACTPLQWFLA